MGSSFIEYRGYGFWSADAFIERLARETAAAIEKQTNNEAWQADLAAHWRAQASGNFNGWIHLDLDEFLTGEERRAQIRDVVQSVTKEYAEEDPIYRTGLLLVRLLDGELQTNATSPLGYMVGTHPSRPKI